MAYLLVLFFSSAEGLNIHGLNLNPGRGNSPNPFGIPVQPGQNLFGFLNPNNPGVNPFAPQPAVNPVGTNPIPPPQPPPGSSGIETFTVTTPQTFVECETLSYDDVS